jgi:hypothetical protein
VTVPRLRAVLLGVLLAGLSRPAAAEPAPSPQQNGPARLVVEGGTLRDGRVELRLSGVLHLVLTVEAGRRLEVEPVRDVTGAEGWNVRPPRPAERTALGTDRVRWRQDLVLEPMRPGDHSLTLAPLRYRDGEGGWESASWQPIPVRVTQEVSGADLKQLHDIRPPLRPPEPPPWPRWPLGVGAAAVLAALAAAIWRLSLRRQPAPGALPPGEWALQELDRLEAQDLPSRGEINLYHTLLSDTVRHYLELRFQLPASHQTTAEFLEAVGGSDQLAASQRELLREFFERCDLAKFAGAAPSPEECAAAAEQARAFVAETASPAASASSPA